LSGIIYFYASQLVRDPSKLPMVPLYLCHLAPDQRDNLLAELLAAANETYADSSCLELFMNLYETLGKWWARQERLDRQLQFGGVPGIPRPEMQEEQLPTSYLYGEEIR
jgi:hypothetical protein